MTGLADGHGTHQRTRTPKQDLRWGDVVLRTASALVLAPLVLWCAWAGGAWWMGAVGLTSIGLAMEWAGLTGQAVMSLSFVMVAASLLAACHEATRVAGAALGALVAAAGFAGFLRPGLAPSLGILYLGAGVVCLVSLRQGQAGRDNLLFLLLVVWASDTGAYFVGRWLGGPKLAPSISPGKTQSGAMGGLVFGVITGVVAAYLIGAGPGRLWAAAAAACLFAVTEQAGDLLESAIKRHFGKKDSGTIIPGHGGLLDRLDGLLAAAPVALAMSYAAGRGARLWE